MLVAIGGCAQPKIILYEKKAKVQFIFHAYANIQTQELRK